MNNKHKNIVAWVSVWAGLLLLVLYSPLGSPELYQERTYFTDYQGTGVVPDHMAIANSPNTGNLGHQSSLNISSIPVISNTKDHFIANSGSYSSKNTDNVAPAYYNEENTPTPNQPSQMMGMDNGFMAPLAGGNSAGNNGLLSGGLLSQSSDQTLLTNSPNKQGAGDVLPPLTTDPGGDPFGPPIPVGDGWWILAGFAIAYVAVKRFLLPQR